MFIVKPSGKNPPGLPLNLNSSLPAREMEGIQTQDPDSDPLATWPCPLCCVTLSGHAQCSPVILNIQFILYHFRKHND